MIEILFTTRMCCLHSCWRKSVKEGSENLSQSALEHNEKLLWQECKRNHPLQHCVKMPQHLQVFPRRTRFLMTSFHIQESGHRVCGLSHESVIWTGIIFNHTDGGHMRCLKPDSCQLLHTTTAHILFISDLKLLAETINLSLHWHFFWPLYNKWRKECKISTSQ